MTEGAPHLDVEYYSDLLCVWALIAELKNAELQAHFGNQIELSCRYLDLFCDTETRIGKGWNNKGGYAGFGDHVRAVASRYLDQQVSPLIWNEVRPATSANAHLYVKATELALGAAEGQRAAQALRKGFFFDAQDIGQVAVIGSVLDKVGVARSALEPEIESGRALAALLSDSRNAQEARVAGSPTWRLNEGRQQLYGNVGYRVLAANIEELLRHPNHEASWC